MSKTPLLDRLRAGDPTPPWWIERARLEEWSRHRDQMLPLVRDPALPAFNVDAVAKYYFEDNPRENWLIDDLPGLKVPYGRCWMEHIIPARIHSEIGDCDLAVFGGGQVGWLLFQAPRAHVKGENIPDNAHAILLCERFVHYAGLGETAGPHGLWMLALDASGTAIGNPCLQTWIRRDRAPDARLLQAGLHVPLLAISDLAVAGLRQPAFL